MPLKGGALKNETGILPFADSSNDYRATPATGDALVALRTAIAEIFNSMPANMANIVHPYRLAAKVFRAQQ